VRPMPVRRLPVGGTYNLRDIGGYPVAGGGVTIWGRLFRSDHPRLDGPGRSQLGRLALRTVVDLRDAAERVARPSQLEGLVGRTINHPLTVRSLLTTETATAPPLGDLYSTAVRNLGAEIAEVVSVLAEPRSLPGLVHCAAGKDRTGIIIGLVLSAVGVSDETVAADYALTAEYLTPEFFADIDFTSLPTGPVDITPLYHAEPTAMSEMLATTRSLAGDAASYLIGHGLALRSLERLRAALVGVQ
jgi:protein-tyrosine phosphatase